MTQLEQARAMQDDLASLRHDLHRDPEIGLHVPRTQQRVVDALAGLPLEITLGRQTTSVTAVLRGGRPGPAVLLRADMDALPVHELSGEPFASEVEGVMHACGHDLHMTMLVGAARLLCAVRDDLPGSVVFMFQPGEEGDGGARFMIEEGVLDAAGSRAVAAYGIHVIAGRTHGLFVARAGALQAGVDELVVTVRGRGGHGSLPDKAQDPVPAACEMVLALQTMVTRRFDVFDPVVVTTGLVRAGTKSNIIPDTAHFETTIRTLSPRTHELMASETVRVVRGIAAAHGLEVDADYVPAYPVTVNDAGQTEFVRETVTDLFGAGRYESMPDPIMGAEDFSYVLEQVPGCYVHLGAARPGADAEAVDVNHSARAVFDDRVLADGAALLAELASRRLSQG